MIRFKFDPFKLVVAVAHDLYPSVKADVMFCSPEKAELGTTDFGPRVPVILVSVDVPVGMAPQILAHEIAHVAVGFKAGHGPKWKKAMKDIHREYQKRLMALAKATGMKPFKPIK